MFLSLVSLAACNAPSDALPEKKNNGSSSLRSQTILEGKWTWIKTNGSGIAGPYTSDSVSVGYSMQYDFGFSELQTYRNSEKFEHFTYSYVVSETPGEQKITLKDDAGNEQLFLWKRQVVNGQNQLILNSTEPCCDNAFEQHFNMISSPNLNGLK